MKRSIRSLFLIGFMFVARRNDRGVIAHGAAAQPVANDASPAVRQPEDIAEGKRLADYFLRGLPRRERHQH